MFFIDQASIVPHGFAQMHAYTWTARSGWWWLRSFFSIYPLTSMYLFLHGRCCFMLQLMSRRVFYALYSSSTSNNIYFSGNRETAAFHPKRITLRSIAHFSHQAYFFCHFKSILCVLYHWLAYSPTTSYETMSNFVSLDKKVPSPGKTQFYTKRYRSLPLHIW